MRVEFDQERIWPSGSTINQPRHPGHWYRASMSRLIFLVSFLAVASSLHGTSIVILRSPHGTKIVVAADSQFSIDSAAPVSGCKIVQIEKTYWTAISGLASEPGTQFNSYQIALDASSHHRNNLDDIASEIRDKTLATLPSALKHRQKAIGKDTFWREYKDGFDAHEEALWGMEDGVVRLIYIQFILHRGRFGKLELFSTVRKCPGEACADPASGFGAFLGHHKVIDKFTAENPDWPRQGNLETLAKQFVQMEIDSELDCRCSLPVSVLSMDKFGAANWVGQRSPSCQLPK